MNTCKNCNTPISGNFCSNCGKPASLKKIDGQYIFREIANFFYAEKGWLYTTKKMFVTPGESVREYLTEDRTRYIKPITFVVITSLIYTFVTHFFHIDAQTIQAQIPKAEPEIQPLQTILINWIIDNNGYASMIISFLMAFWLKLFFRKSGYNLFEFFVLICYISGIASLLSSVIFIIQGVINLSLIKIKIIIPAIYSIWAIGHFFNKKKIENYFKTLLAFLFGTLTFAFLIVLIMTFLYVALQ